MPRLISALVLSSQFNCSTGRRRRGGRGVCVSAPVPLLRPSSAAVLSFAHGEIGTTLVREGGSERGHPTRCTRLLTHHLPSSLGGRPSSNRRSEEGEGEEGEGGRPGGRAIGGRGGRTRAGERERERERGALSKLPGSLAAAASPRALAHFLGLRTFVRRLWPFPAIVLCRLLSLSLSVRVRLRRRCST